MCVRAAKSYPSRWKMFPFRLGLSVVFSARLLCCRSGGRRRRRRERGQGNEEVWRLRRRPFAVCIKRRKEKMEVKKERLLFPLHPTSTALLPKSLLKSRKPPPPLHYGWLSFSMAQFKVNALPFQRLLLMEAPNGRSTTASSVLFHHIAVP